MTTQIQTTAAMRRFNQALERADLLYHRQAQLAFSPRRSLSLPELSLSQTCDWLDQHQFDNAALELKLAGQAVGYFKE